MKKTLSKRETQVLKMLLAEYRQKEIADTLGISFNRVHDIKRIIFEKWEVESMVGLTREAIRRGILELEDDTFKPVTEVRQKATKYVYNYIIK